MPIVEFLAIALISGWVIGKARQRKGKSFGILTSLMVGIIGSFIGLFLMGFLKIETPTLLIKLAMSILGVTVFFFGVGLVSGKKKKKSEDEE